MDLDVGCGFRPLGDVNVDVSKDADAKTRQTSWIGNVKAIPNFVLADGCHLPFRNETFEVVFADNIMEYPENHFLFLKELLRVFKREVCITVPHRLKCKDWGLRKQHFTVTWFRNALLKLGFVNFDIYVSRFSSYPHAYIPLVTLPREITVKVFKGKRKN